MTTQNRSGSRWTPRRLALIAGAVVALALVIFGLAALSSPDARGPQKPSAVEPSIKAERLAAEAEKAASENDTETARTLAKQALALDSTNGTAKRVSESLDEPAQSGGAGGTGAGGSGNAGGNGSATGGNALPDQAYLNPVANPSQLLPAAYQGWNKGQVSVSGADALVTFEPTPAARIPVTRATLYAYDLTSAEKAKAFVAKTEAGSFPADAAQVAVGVVKDGRFGTDDVAVASVVFARGRYAFEVLVSAKPGVDPATLKSTALALAQSMPAAK